MLIGQRIKSMRIEQGLSIDDLASKLGKNRTTIYRYENGNIENLPLSILDSLANALNTTPAYLMGWENSNGVCHGHERNEPPEMKYMVKWITEMGLNSLTEDECLKVLEYAKFLVTQRDK